MAPQKSTKKFAHLHVHTEHSSLDGLGTIKDYVDRALVLGQPAMAITDHGNLCGAPEFYHYARKVGIEPIIGEEFYFVPDVTQKQRKEDEKARYHVVILAKGEAGYRVLTELSSESHRNYYYKPLIDRKMLEQLGDDARHLTVFSGCAASIINVKLMEEDYDAANFEVQWWRDTFPNFYIEMMNHECDFDKPINDRLLQMARAFDLPIVITNDPHYVVPEDDCHHDALLAIQTASDIDDPNRFRFSGSGYYLKSRKEMRRAFREWGPDVWAEGARNTLKIAKDCRTRIPEWESRTWHLPTFPDTDDSKTLLKKLTSRGLKRRGLRDNEEYVARARHELKIINQVGIADFLLITMDIIQAAREKGIPVGPGRGSVCGSLVCYLIGIHKIDPIKYTLRFDRFLNPARPRMPDIDTDFGQKRRMEMFTYVEEKYGLENVVHVAVHSRMKTKAAFQSLAKAYGVSHTDRIRISKELDEDAEDSNLPLEMTENFPELSAQVKRLAGVKKGVSTHPAGVIIADPQVSIRNIVPEMWLANTKRMVGQYNLDAAEETGLMKEDFLGLRTLDTIDECVQLIEATTGEVLDPDSWLPDEEVDDADVYAMLAEGRTSGIFQMEGPVNQRGCKQVKPKEFEDIVSITSLYRTGPIAAGYPKIFNENRKSGRNRIEYAHPLLKPILEDTWGVILYQEQVMTIAEVLAGFDMVRVDDIKEAIKHKKGPLMVSLRPEFIKGCAETNGIDEETSDAIWSDIEGYSGYSYNRSHAVAYSFSTYQTARLKALWPAQYLTALLRTVDSSNPTGKERREGYLREAAGLDLEIYKPDINKSQTYAYPEEGGIRFGFADIKGVKTAGTRIVEGRPEGGYQTMSQVETVVKNKGIMEKLAKAGALDCLGYESTDEGAEELLQWNFTDMMRNFRRTYRDQVVLPEESIDGHVQLVGEIYKITKGKTKTDKNFLTWKIRWSPSDSFDIRLWSGTERHWNLPLGSVVMVAGEFEPKWLNISIGNPHQIRVVHRA